MRPCAKPPPKNEPCPSHPLKFPRPTHPCARAAPLPAPRHGRFALPCACPCASISAQMFFRIYDPDSTDMITQQQLAQGFEDVLVPPGGGLGRDPVQLEAKAAAIMVFVDKAGRGHFMQQDLEVACRDNLTFLQYCATLC